MKLFAKLTGSKSSLKLDRLVPCLVSVNLEWLLYVYMLYVYTLLGVTSVLNSHTFRMMDFWSKLLVLWHQHTHTHTHTPFHFLSLFTQKHQNLPQKCTPMYCKIQWKTNTNFKTECLPCITKGWSATDNMNQLCHRKVVDQQMILLSSHYLYVHLTNLSPPHNKHCPIFGNWHCWRRMA